jgi:hypothetical protein
MKRRIAVLGLLVLGIALLAVAAADMSGTWVLDKAKSDPIRMGRPGGDAGGPPPDINITLVIKQSASDVAISRTMSMGGNDRTTDQKFTLDGKESVNPSGGRGGELKAKAKLSDGKLVIEGTQKMSTPNGDVELAVKDEYAVSDDGTVLTLTSTRTTPQGDRTSKQVYNKK